MPPPQQTVFGATVEPTSPPPSQFQPTVTDDENLPTPAPRARVFSGVDQLSNTNNPCSAFYTHPTTRHSLEQIRTSSQTSSSERDLESGTAVRSKTGPLRVTQTASRGQVSGHEGYEPSKDVTGKNMAMVECTVWPSRRAWEEKAMMVKKREGRRNWNCLAGLTKRQTLVVRLLIGLVIVAIAVGLGVGISRAVGGRVLKSDGQQVQIPS